MRVALVHEFLTQRGGAERVLRAFHGIFPDAPVYTLVQDPQRTAGAFADLDIRASYLQKLPGMPKNYKWYLPLMRRAIESFDFGAYDLVLSDASAFAKGVLTKNPAIHVCYCHTPTRYLWQSMDEYVGDLPQGPAAKAAARWYLRAVLKNWDKQAADRPDFFIANSRTVQERIRKYYHRSSEVIYPPVDTGFFKPVSPDRESYFFAASRLETYKKIDVVVEAFQILGLPLKVAGSGSLLARFQKAAPRNIEFLGQVTDERLRELYSRAQAFIFPALEDAGIMVLESLACGTPVVALNAGGSAEYIRDGENGVLFASQSPEEIGKAVRRIQHLSFDREELRKNALPFDIRIFQQKIKQFLSSHANWH